MVLAAATSDTSNSANSVPAIRPHAVFNVARTTLMCPAQIAPSANAAAHAASTGSSTSPPIAWRGPSTSAPDTRRAASARLIRIRVANTSTQDFPPISCALARSISAAWMRCPIIASARAYRSRSDWMANNSAVSNTVKSASSKALVDAA